MPCLYYGTQMKRIFYDLRRFNATINQILFNLKQSASSAYYQTTNMLLPLVTELVEGQGELSAGLRGKTRPNHEDTKPTPVK